ncbi:MULTISPECIES: hypothetical protein [Fusobacterium]|uniref:hypothetical protein n=1 Tax=Fusobacterium TaxID=848 RepID=UPI0001A2A5CD|nr:MULTISPECIES: hypothetical protein [Fusobacterium]MDY2799939.1 hypothetical protein [Fusobacterium mortiferum]
MRIGIVGTVYVGLVQGIIITKFGLNVICIDVSEEKIENLREGIVPIDELELKEILDIEDRLKARGIEFTTDIKYTIENSEVIFIEVGIPSAFRWISRFIFCIRSRKKNRTIYE